MSQSGSNRRLARRSLCLALATAIACVGCTNTKRSRASTEQDNFEGNPSALFSRTLTSTGSSRPNALLEMLATDDTSGARPPDLASLARVGMFGPFAGDAFSPASDCDWRSFDVSVSPGFGNSIGFPESRISGPTAIDVVIPDPYERGSRSRPATLIVHAQPGLNVRAKYSDGYVDDTAVASSGIALLVGSHAMSSDPRTAIPTGTKITGRSGSGEVTWRTTSVPLAQLANTRADAPCVPPPADSIGVAADAATTDAATTLLSKVVGATSPDGGSSNLVAGWTPELEEKLAAARKLALRSVASDGWTVTVEAVRVVGERRWAYVDLGPIGAYWVELVSTPQGALQITRASLCHVEIASLCPAG